MKNRLIIRKTHRYLGIFLGIQFLLWTVSGLYFSWSNLDRIHGDHFKNLNHQPTAFFDLNPLKELRIKEGIHSLELREIGGQPFYWINENRLFNARTGEEKRIITKEEALDIAYHYMDANLIVKDIHLLEEVNKYHEYRDLPLPVYVISYQHPAKVKAYISAKDGAFQRVRHESWRWFDFLWMTHTMDYESRDNINSILLRVFSLLGLITVVSGFLLWAITSKTLKRILKSTRKYHD
ncbi:MAG: PepSY domain-containing protein [Saprospiraceae bacterium]|nr:PepSY domain-containing protein [Saprospiraceae bacterium]